MDQRTDNGETVVARQIAKVAVVGHDNAILSRDPGYCGREFRVQVRQFGDQRPTGGLI